MTPRLALLRQQPDAAFEKLYRQHVGDVYRYTLAVLGNPADAEDVTQTTFMNAYRAFHAGDRPRKAGAWLRTIAHNVCRQRWRADSRRPREVAELHEAMGPAGAVAGPVPDDEGPSAADITRALQSLPFNQRSALVMRELEGRRQAEIAAALDLSESAVEALLFRARRAMREQLESSITCGEAARAISRQLDRSLSREERGALRAHLRECEDCAGFARQARASRGAMKTLGAVPLPVGLLSWSSGAGSGGAAVGGATAAAAGGSAGGLTALAGGAAGTTAGFGLKVAAGLVVVAVVAGGGERALRAPEAGRPAGDTDGQQAADSARTPADASARTAALRNGQGGPRAPSRPASRTAASGRSRHAGRRHGASRNGNRPGDASPTTTPGPRGTPVRAHGTPTHARGTPAQSNGNATRAHGAPSHSNGTPARAHGTPTRAHGSPHANGSTPQLPAPPGANGTPTRAHGAPPKDPEKTPRP